MDGLALLIVIPGVVLAVLLVFLALLLLPEGRQQGKRLAKDPAREARKARREERARAARDRALREKASPDWRDRVRRASSLLARVEAVNGGFFFCQVEDRYTRTRVLPLRAVLGRRDWEALARELVREDPVLRDAAARLAENRSVSLDYREQLALLGPPLGPEEAERLDIPYETCRALEEGLLAEAVLHPALDSRLAVVVKFRGPGGRALFPRRRELSLWEAAGRREGVPVQGR